MSTEARMKELEIWDLIQTQCCIMAHMTLPETDFDSMEIKSKYHHAKK